MTAKTITKQTRLFTSESVTEGHPDKICDQISDAILDAYLALDPFSRVAVETATTTDLVVIMGEITSRAQEESVDVRKIARDTIRKIGYSDEFGFDPNTCNILVYLHTQSPDIAQGVDNALEMRDGCLVDARLDKIGAGDQGMVFGYATNETEELMPLPIVLAHRITRALSEARKHNSKYAGLLGPDGKAQVTVEYDNTGKPVRVDTVLLSTQHTPEADLQELRAWLEEDIILKVIPEELYDESTKFLFNPTGRFVIGGPAGDTGLTGRKIIVDTYGGTARHGGGAFSGKDPTKVDRSAAYAARYVAKNIVAAGLADKCEIQIAYAIGVARPVSVLVDTFGTGRIPDSAIERLIDACFDLRPAGIIQMLNLRRPVYSQTAAYGHFGRTDVDLPWERTDKAEQLVAMAFQEGV